MFQVDFQGTCTSSTGDTSWVSASGVSWLRNVPTLDAIIKGLFARCIVLCSCASIKYASILSYSLFIRSRLGFPLPDLSGELQIAVGTAGPQPRAPDLSGHCWTSAASSTSQRALPASQLRAPDRSGHCPTSTASPRSQWALRASTAGPQPRGACG